MPATKAKDKVSIDPLLVQIRELRDQALLRKICILCVEHALPYDKTDSCKTVLALLNDPATTQEQFRNAANAGYATYAARAAHAAYTAAKNKAARERFVAELFLLVNFGGKH